MTPRNSYDTVRRILLEEWDPIGIRDVKAARDEYDDYARHILSRVFSGHRPSEIKAYLLQVETKMMGLDPDRERARRVVERLQGSTSG